MLVTYILSLNSMFLQETNAFYCVTVDFSVENCECSKVLFAGSKVHPGWGSFKQDTVVIKIGSAIKIIRRGQFACYRNAVMYIALCCNYIFLLVDENIKI